MVEPNQCLCCNLKTGILSWGVVVMLWNFFLAGALIYFLSTEGDPKKQGAFFWAVAIVAGFCICWTVFRTYVMIKGVAMDIPKMVKVFIIILYVEVAFHIIGGIYQIIYKPVSLIGTGLGLAIDWYNILCVQSYENKLLLSMDTSDQGNKNENNLSNC